MVLTDPPLDRSSMLAPFAADATMVIAVGLANLIERRSGPEPLTESAPAVIVEADSMMRSSPAVALARLTAAPE